VRHRPGARQRISVAACGENLLAVVGVGRIQTTVSDERLAIVFVGKPAQYLTPTTLAYLSPSCSPDGFTVAAVQYPTAEDSPDRRRSRR